MNWFERHPGFLAATVAFHFYVLVAGLALSAGPPPSCQADYLGLGVVVCGPAGLVPVHFRAFGLPGWATGATWPVLIVAAWLWAYAARLKGRSSAWAMLPVVLPFGWVALLGIKPAQQAFAQE